MDINTNTLQHQTAVTPLKIVNTKQSIDSSVNGADARASIDSAKAVTKEKDTENPDDLKQAVSQINDYVQNIQRNLQFSIDPKSGTTVVKVIDTKSEKVIRQMPNEETLRLARSLVEQSDESAFNIFSSRA